MDKFLFWKERSTLNRNAHKYIKYCCQVYQTTRTTCKEDTRSWNQIWYSQLVFCYRESKSDVIKNLISLINLKTLQKFGLFHVLLIMLLVYCNITLKWCTVSFSCKNVKLEKQQLRNYRFPQRYCFTGWQGWRPQTR
jgi:hypothetical protein